MLSDNLTTEQKKERIEKLKVYGQDFLDYVNTQIEEAQKLRDNADDTDKTQKNKVTNSSIVSEKLKSASSSKQNIFADYLKSLKSSPQNISQNNTRTILNMDDNFEKENLTKEDLLMLLQTSPYSEAFIAFITEVLYRKKFNLYLPNPLDQRLTFLLTDNSNILLTIMGIFSVCLLGGGGLWLLTGWLLSMGAPLAICILFSMVAAAFVAQIFIIFDEYSRTQGTKLSTILWYSIPLVLLFTLMCDDDVLAKSSNTIMAGAAGALVYSAIVLALTLLTLFSVIHLSLPLLSVLLLLAVISCAVVICCKVTAAIEQNQINQEVINIVKINIVKINQPTQEQSNDQKINHTLSDTKKPSNFFSSLNKFLSGWCGGGDQDERKSKFQPV